MSAHSLLRKAERLLSEDQPVRFVLGRLLWRTGLCRLITYQMPDGYRMRFHPSAISAALWQDRRFRTEDTDVIRKILRPGDAYVDVGANVGQLAIIAARQVGSAGLVLAIEPHPRTYRFLTENCALNGLRIDTRNVAVGDREGTLPFTDLPLDDQNFVATGLPGGGRQVDVRVTTLDALVPERPIRLMKIDVEGFELHALAGGGATLSRCSCVYIEESSKNLARYGGTPERLHAALVDAGFTLLTDDGRPLSPPGPGDQGSRNVLAVRTNDVDEIRARLRR